MTVCPWVLPVQQGDCMVEPARWRYLENHLPAWRCHRGKHRAFHPGAALYDRTLANASTDCYTQESMPWWTMPEEANRYW